SFIDTLENWLGKTSHPGVKAVQLFCQNLKKCPEAAPALLERFQLKDEFEKRDPVLTFRLEGDTESVHLRPEVRTAYDAAFSATRSEHPLRGNCLVTGRTDVPLAPNESVIKGVWGGQPAGCNIVSFNARAFES